MISVVIPVFNEQENLPRLYERLSRGAKSWNESREMLCVDDGSADGTCAALLELHQRDERVRAVSFLRNFGRQTAVTAGLSLIALLERLPGDLCVRTKTPGIPSDLYVPSFF